MSDLTRIEAGSGAYVQLPLQTWSYVQPNTKRVSVSLWYRVHRADAGAIEDLFYTKYLAVRYHVVHGVLLALGVVAQRAFLSPDLFFAPL
mgnify:CR=1 FL=1